MRIGGRGLKEMHRKLLPCGWAEGRGSCSHREDVTDQNDGGHSSEDSDNI